MKDLIDKNHISCIIIEDIRDIVEHVKDLKDYKIFICSSDTNIVNNIYKQFLKYYDQVELLRDSGKLEHKRMTICKSEVVKKILLDCIYNEDSSIDFCDLLIVCDMTINKNDNIIIGKLWNKLLKSKRQILIPKLSLCVSEPYINMDIDLTFNKDNIQVIKSEPKNIEYVDGFRDDVERIEIIVKLLEERHTEDKKCIVFCKTPYECRYLKELIPDSIFMDFEEFSPEEKRIFITFQHYQFIQNVDDVYDCMLDSKVYSKQRSELAGDKCFRLMTFKDFENINPISDFEDDNLKLDILRLVDKNVIFENHQEIIGNLKKDDFVNYDNSLSEKGLFCKNLDISPEFSNLVLESESRGFDIFPCIVAASIFNFMDSRLFLTPDENKQEHFNEFFNNDHTDTFLELYLSVWNVYYDDFEGNEPTIYSLMDWCKERMINVSTFQKILKTIKIIKQQYELMTDIEVIETKIDPKQTCLDLEKIFKSEYNHKICKMINKIECVDHDFKTYKLDLSNHYNPYIIEPTYIIPLVKRNNKILFYHPV